MELTRGSVVRSRAGRDRDRYFAVLAVEGERVVLTDGRLHPLERPKRKNLRHVAGTAVRLDSELLAANGRIRRALAERFTANRPGSNPEIRTQCAAQPLKGG